MSTTSNPFKFCGCLLLGLALGVSAQAAERPEGLSFAADEVVKLVNGGVDAKIISAYVQTSSHPYQLQANDIVYLHETGVSSDVITAMIKHDQERPQQPVAAAPAQAPAQAAPVATAPTVVYAGSPYYYDTVYRSPSVYVVGSDYYSYPYGYSYSYPSFYVSPFRVGFGFGFGGRGGFSHGGFSHGGFSHHGGHR